MSEASSLHDFVPSSPPVGPPLQDPLDLETQAREAILRACWLSTSPEPDIEGVEGVDAIATESEEENEEEKGLDTQLRERDAPEMSPLTPPPSNQPPRVHFEGIKGIQQSPQDASTAVRRSGRVLKATEAAQQQKVDEIRTSQKSRKRKATVQPQTPQNTAKRTAKPLQQRSSNPRVNTTSNQKKRATVKAKNPTAKPTASLPKAARKPQPPTKSHQTKAGGRSSNQRQPPREDPEAIDLTVVEISPQTEQPLSQSQSRTSQAQRAIKAPPPPVQFKLYFVAEFDSEVIHQPNMQYG